MTVLLENFTHDFICLFIGDVPLVYGYGGFFVNGRHVPRGVWGKGVIDISRLRSVLKNGRRTAKEKPRLEPSTF